MKFNAGPVSLRRFCSLLNQLPWQNHIILEIVRVVDQLGRSILMPTVFCSTWEVFLSFLSLYPSADKSRTLGLRLYYQMLLSKLPRRFLCEAGWVWGDTFARWSGHPPLWFHLRGWAWGGFRDRHFLAGVWSLAGYRGIMSPMPALWSRTALWQTNDNKIIHFEMHATEAEDLRTDMSSGGEGCITSCLYTYGLFNTDIGLARI